MVSTSAARAASRPGHAPERRDGPGAFTTRPATVTAISAVGADPRRHQPAVPPPPGYDVLRHRRRARRGRRAVRRRRPPSAGRRTSGALAGTAQAQRVGRPGRTTHPRPAHPRPLPANGSTRSTSTRPGTRLMDVAVGDGLTAEPWTRPAGSRRPRAPRRRLHRLVAGRGGPPLPGLDDVRRGAGPAADPAWPRTLAARARLARRTTRAAPAGRQGRAAGGHGHDREAGRLRRPGQHDAARRARGPADGDTTGSPATSGSARPR